MKMIIWSCLLFISTGGCKKEINSLPAAAIKVSGTLTVYPAPGDLNLVEHLKKSDDYIVEVRKKGETDYQSLFVYKTDNYWIDTYFGGAPKPQASASFTSFAMLETAVEVKVTFKSAAGQVMIRPLNFGINPVVNGNTVTFTLGEPRKLSIEINDRKNPLFLFAEAPDVPNTAATYYYGPGVHNIGLQKSIKSGESVYIAAGAVVEGSFMLPYNTKNISIRGRGILTMGEWKHESTDIAWLGAHSAIKANGTSNLQMEGIIIANSCGWTIPIYNSDNLTFDNQFRNLKLISWNGNTDGFWVNGNNHLIDDCFIFNNDDIFMSHGATNCKISNIVAWGGPWGRLYWVSNQKSTSKIILENINLIGKDGGVGVIVVDGATGTDLTVSDITFRNLRIEAHPKTSSYNTNKLFVFNSGYKSTTNWLFENVTVDDKNPDEGGFFGTERARITGVKFKNFKMAGLKVNSLSEGNLGSNAFASGITFE
ncbi:glycosyl hydrolase family 28 protein [Dyadobacter sp. 3J3]|uniref:glycosyl hydrolase family 28 protein n=1 Tax=Dyadobacter sp. 3J3 TaxID=2606600 RepID=UPI0013571495|nr:glycosyl hydrolase family 28 protein [Dyadobacter sp. 3J3]